MRRLWVALLLLILSSISSWTQKLVPSNISPPVPLNNPAAPPPPEAMQKRMNGGCLVSLLVDTEGRPQDLKLIRCTDPCFGENSLNAAAQYRFKPAADQHGKAVAVMIQIEIRILIRGGSDLAPVLLTFGPPPENVASASDAGGAYPLSSAVGPPLLSRFSDEGYEAASSLFAKSNACDVVITIDAKGKPSNPVVTQCNKSALEGPAVESLLKSKYKPGTLNGKPVPVRATVHLEYGGYPPQS